MNECFFIGKIIGNIDFKFIKQTKNMKNNSILMFQLKLLDKNVIKIKAYNEMADLCYRNLKKNDFVFVIGKIETMGVINIKFIKKIFISGVKDNV